MASKGNRDRRQRRGRAESAETVLVVGLDLMGGGTSEVEVSAEVGMRYIDLHRVIPPYITSWSADHVRRLAGGLEQGGSRRRWEAALILLAHHRSRLARDLLLSLGPRVPDPVREFYEIALGESQSWLGGGRGEEAGAPVPGTFISRGEKAN